MRTSKKHHYVPRFYLRNFCLPNSDCIYCYDKLNDNDFLTKIQKIAEENSFYGLRSSVKDGVEVSISKAESKFYAPSYQEFIAKKNYSNISHESKKWFFVFLAFQMTRTLQSRKHIREMYEGVVRELRKHKKLGDELERQVRIIEKNLNNEDYFKKIHLMYLIEPSDELFKLASFFFNKKWVILLNKTDYELWTSDNPLSVYNSFNYEGNLGILSKGVEIRFPLTKNLLLFSFDPDTNPPKNNKDKMTGEEVQFANSCQIRSSTRFIYSSKNSFHIAKDYLKNYPKFKNPDRDRSAFFSNRDLIESIELE